MGFERRCRSAALRALFFFLGSLNLLILSGCGRRPAQDGFIQPYPRAAAYRYLVIPNTRQRENFIETAINRPYTWKLPTRTKGTLKFSLYVEVLDKLTDWQFVVTAGQESLLSKVLPAVEFQFIKRVYRRRGIVRCYWQGTFALVCDRPAGTELVFALKPLAAPAGANPLWSRGRFCLGQMRVVSIKPEKFRNVLLITIDTLRADYVGAYQENPVGAGTKKSPSPVIDSLAEESALFLHAYTPLGSTWPALASLFVSKMPFQHGVRVNGLQLLRSMPNLASRLFDKGFFTAALRANGSALLLDGFHLACGSRLDDGETLSAALRLLNDNRNQRFFLWVHFLGVHSPYLPPNDVLQNVEGQAYGGTIVPQQQVLVEISRGNIPVTAADIQHIRHCYTAELQVVDSRVGELLQCLKRLGLWQQTLLVLTADHGEDLFDHNRHFFHAPSIYNSVMHVPLIVKLPGVIRRHRVEQNVSLMDIMPTVLDFCGVSPGAEMEGISLRPLLEGRGAIADRLLFGESTANGIFSVVHKDWQLIRNFSGVPAKTSFGTPYPLAAFELYHLQRDPGEAANLYAKNISLAFALERKLRDYLRQRRYQARSQAGLPQNIAPEVLRELRALGYLDQ